MILSPARLCALCGASLLAAAGCYSSPYGGYGGYPTYTVPPGGTVVPGGTYMSPATPGMLSAPGTLSAPGSTFPTPADPNWQPTPQTYPTPAGSSNDAPLFNSPSTPATIPQTNPVPNYGDPNSPDFNSFPSGPSSSPTNTTPFSSSTQGVGGEAFSQDGSGVKLKGIESSAAFQVDVHPASSRNEPFAQSSAPSTATNNMAFRPDGPAFAFDAAAYRWLRGKVDYDDVDRSWNIIYNLVPDETDLYQGSITLADGPLVSRLQHDTYVLLEGRPDPQHRDSRGRPCYHVERIAGPFPPRG